MSVVDLGKSTLSTPVTDGFWAAEVLETGSGTRPQAACLHLLLPWLQVSLAPLWKKWKYTSKCTRANSQVSWVPGQSVLGVFVCLQEWVVSEFCGTKFCLCLLVGRGLWCSSPSSPLLLLVSVSITMMIRWALGSFSSQFSLHLGLIWFPPVLVVTDFCHHHRAFLP